MDESERAQVRREPTPGKRIAKAIELARTNMSEVSRRMDVAYTTVWKWAHDKTAPTVPLLRRFGDIVGVSVSDLLDKEGHTVTEPQYEAWGKFLETEEGRSLTDDERLTLASVHFELPLNPTVATYQGWLAILRGTSTRP